MQKFLSCAQMRVADEYTINTLGIPSSVLMQRAGEAVAAEVEKAAEEFGKNILVVCGGGNNGGDGYVCACVLLEKGYAVAVFDASDGNYSSDCAARKKTYKGGYAKEIKGDIIVDCIFGVGLNRKVEGDCAEIIDEINASGAFIISVDIPSGISGDNGLVHGIAVNADMTVAIAEYKLGHVLNDGPDYCGAIVKADIGIKAEGDYAVAYDDADIARFFPERRHNTHKGSYGSACIAAGSDMYPGAAALCVCAALRSGCGYVKLSSRDSVKNALVTAHPQAIYISQPDYSSRCLAIGPGCGDTIQVYEGIVAALKNYKGKLIIDADGLNALSKYDPDAFAQKECPVLITPHVKEFSRLTGKKLSSVLADPVNCAKDYAKKYGVIVLLKGASTVITDGERVVLNLRGNTALAKGGSGDMLTGFACGTAARGLNLFDSAVCASYVLGCAAEIASAEKTEYCTTAEDILEGIAAAVKTITLG